MATHLPLRSLVWTGAFLLAGLAAPIETEAATAALVPSSHNFTSNNEYITVEVQVTVGAGEEFDELTVDVDFSTGLDSSWMVTGLSGPATGNDEAFDIGCAGIRPDGETSRFFGGVSVDKEIGNTGPPLFDPILREPIPPGTYTIGSFYLVAPTAGSDPGKTLTQKLADGVAGFGLPIQVGFSGQPRGTVLGTYTINGGQ